MGIVNFTKKVWDYVTHAVNPTNLNRLENGINDCANAINDGMVDEAGTIKANVAKDSEKLGGKLASVYYNSSDKKPPAGDIAQNSNHRFVTDTEKSTWNGKEPAITKKTAFNKNFGNAAGTVSEGNHIHDDRYSKLAHKHSQLDFSDTRDESTTPASYSKNLSLDFKRASVLGISDGTYMDLIGFKSWSDDSGGAAHELAFGDSGYIYHRYGKETGGWQAWKQLEEKGHTHDDRYYTETEIDSKLSGKADNHDHPYKPNSYNPVYNGIRDGQTATSPSEEAVFNALAGKSSSGHSHAGLTDPDEQMSLDFIQGALVVNNRGFPHPISLNPAEWEYIGYAKDADYSSSIIISSSDDSDFFDFSKYDYKFVYHGMTSAEDTSKPYIQLNGDSSEDIYGYVYHYSKADTSTTTVSGQHSNIGGTYINTGLSLDPTATGVALTSLYIEFIVSRNDKIADITRSYQVIGRGVINSSGDACVPSLADNYVIVGDFAGVYENGPENLTSVTLYHGITLGSVDYNKLEVYRREKH